MKFNYKLIITVFIIIFRPLQTFLGGAYAIQLFFAVISICGFVFALLFLPETHGKKLSDIQAYFDNSNKKKKKTAKATSKKNSTNGTKTSYRKAPALETVEEAEKMLARDEVQNKV